MLKRLGTALLVFLLACGYAQAQATSKTLCGTGNAPPNDWSPCIPLSGSVGWAGTIGSAVPLSGVYNAVNVAGNLRGWSGLSTGSLFPGAVAIVDASGNQITSFGSTTSNAPVAAGVATATTSVLSGCQYLLSLPTYANTNQGSCTFDVNGRLLVSGAGGTFPVTGTFFQSTQPVSIASAQVASGAVASGAYASGSVASGAFASGSISSGALASGSMVDLLTFQQPIAAGAATATKSLLTGTQYNTTLPAPTNGQQMSVQAGPQGDLFTSVPGQTVPNFAITTSNNTVTTGKAIGGLQTITNAARVSGTAGNPGTGGLIQSVVLNFKDAIGTVPMDVYFYNANPTNSTCTDNTTFVNSYTDVGIVGIAHVTDWTAGNTAATGQINNLAIPYAISSGTSLFVCIVTRGSAAITNTTNANITVGLMRN